MTKYKHYMDTMDGVIESESDVPQPPIKTPEDLEAERVKRYPTEEFASYLLYVCSYCLDKFYLISPDRVEGHNPFRGGYTLESKDGRRLRSVCHRCVLHLSWRREDFRLKY